MSRRLNALVVGNAAYEAVDALKNPVNDAEDIGAKLEACGFTVIRSLDRDHSAMDRALEKFPRALKESNVGLSFFAPCRPRHADRRRQLPRGGGLGRFR